MLRVIPLVGGWTSYYLNKASYTGDIKSKIVTEVNNAYGYNFAYVKSGQPLTLEFTLDKQYQLSDFINPTLVGYKNINGVYIPVSMDKSLAIVDFKMINDTTLQVSYDWDSSERPEYEHISQDADIFNVILSNNEWTYVSDDFIPIEKAHAYDIYHTPDEEYAVLDCNGGSSVEMKIKLDDYLGEFLRNETQTGCQNSFIKLLINPQGSVNPEILNWRIEYDQTTIKPYLVIGIMIHSAQVIDPAFESNPFAVQIYYNNKKANDENTIILPNYKLRIGENDSFQFLGQSKIINFQSPDEPQILQFKLDAGWDFDDIQLTCFDNTIELTPLSWKDQILTVSVKCPEAGLYSDIRIQVSSKNETSKFSCFGFVFNNLNTDVVTYKGSGNFYINKNQINNWFRLPIVTLRNHYEGLINVKLIGDITNYFEVTNVVRNDYLSQSMASKSFLQIQVGHNDNIEVGKKYSGQIQVTYQAPVPVVWTHDINLIVEDSPFELEGQSIMTGYTVKDGESSQISCVDVNKDFSSTVGDLKLTDMEGNEINYTLGYEILSVEGVKFLSFNATGNLNDKLTYYPSCQLEFSIDGQKYHLNNINIDRYNAHVYYHNDYPVECLLSTSVSSKTIDNICFDDQLIEYEASMFDVKLLDENDTEISGITATPSIVTESSTKYLSLTFTPTTATTPLKYTKGYIHISYKPDTEVIWEYNIPSVFEYVNAKPFDINLQTEYDYKTKYIYGSYYEQELTVNSEGFDINRLSFKVGTEALTQEEQEAGWLSTSNFVQFIINNNKMYLYNIQECLSEGDKLMTHYILTFTYRDLSGNIVWTLTKNVTAYCNLKD